MSTQSQPQGEQITAEMVADYLRDYPEFFINQPELLADIRVPHATGSAVSLIERQVTILREQNGRLSNKLADLVQVSEYNEHLTDRIHQLSIALMDAGTLMDVLNVLYHHLHHHFSADAVAVRLKNMPSETIPNVSVHGIDANDPLLSDHETAFKEHRPICGRLSREQMEHVFGHCGVPVKSAAVVPLIKDQIDGYIGLGSRNPDKFHGSKDTLFLRYLGELCSHALARAQGNSKLAL